MKCNAINEFICIYCTFLRRVRDIRVVNYIRFTYVCVCVCARTRVGGGGGWAEPFFPPVNWVNKCHQYHYVPVLLYVNVNNNFLNVTIINLKTHQRCRCFITEFHRGSSNLQVSLSLSWYFEKVSTILRESNHFWGAERWALKHMARCVMNRGISKTKLKITE